MRWGTVMFDASYCTCVRVLCACTRILRPRTRVAVKFIAIACGREVDSLEKLTMSILRYFQKVPSVEPGTTEVPAPHGSEEAVAVKFIAIACGREVDSLEKLTMSILRYFQKVPSVEPGTTEVPAPHGSEEAPVVSGSCSHCTESISPTHFASEVCVDVSEYNETGDSIPPAPK